MFCEIGSTDTHWGRTDAAEVYASVLATVLRLDTCSSSSSSSSGTNDSSTHDDAAWCTLTPQQRSDATVFMCIGGGHYAPRAGDLARKPGVFVGHMLANYSFDWGEAQGWKTAVTEAAAATRTAFPGCSAILISDASHLLSTLAATAIATPSHTLIMNGSSHCTSRLSALVDKKSMKAAQRDALTGLLQQLDIFVAYKKEEILARPSVPLAAATVAADSTHDTSAAASTPAAAAAAAVAR
eukprot:17361-Heterococcus_DN1.PRE.1